MHMPDARVIAANDAIAQLNFMMGGRYRASFCEMAGLQWEVVFMDHESGLAASCTLDPCDMSFDGLVRHLYGPAIQNLRQRAPDGLKPP